MSVVQEPASKIRLVSRKLLRESIANYMHLSLKSPLSKREYVHASRGDNVFLQVNLCGGGGRSQCGGASSDLSSAGSGLVNWGDSEENGWDYLARSRLVLCMTKMAKSWHLLHVSGVKNAAHQQMSWKTSHSSRTYSVIIENNLHWYVMPKVRKKHFHYRCQILFLTDILSSKKPIKKWITYQNTVWIHTKIK